MISTKKHIQQLAALLAAKNIIDIVVSPGSRNGALVQTLVGDGRFNCHNLVDERSAAYFAMGVSQAKQMPVALLCSSGTACLNYAPAVSEAYYQSIPLVLLTADRPEYWINQLEAQCINQRGIYKNFVVDEIQLPLGESPQELSRANREINRCLNMTLKTDKPVHINFPLEEPLYEFAEEELPDHIRNIPHTTTISDLSVEKIELLLNRLNQSDEVLLLVGQMNPLDGLSELIELFADSTGAVVLAEPLANVQVSSKVANFDLLLSRLQPESKEALRPELLITIGGQLVSKRIKQFLREWQPAEHWHIAAEAHYADTYWSLTDVLPVQPKLFFETMLSAFYDVNMGFKFNTPYRTKWTDLALQTEQIFCEAAHDLSFTDMRVHQLLKTYIPQESIVHYGNSSSIRYGILFPSQAGTCYSNRGTSGIDGSFSTAVGFASTSADINTVILGDLSFFYDSNALWNNDFPNNLRIIVLNNGGGNIFGLIPGPNKTQAFQKHFIAAHQFKIKGIVEAFGVAYLSATDEKSLKESLDQVYNNKRRKACVLEIFTNQEQNTTVYQQLFNTIK